MANDLKMDSVLVGSLPIVMKSPSAKRSRKAPMKALLPLVRDGEPVENGRSHRGNLHRAGMLGRIASTNRGACARFTGFGPAAEVAGSKKLGVLVHGNLAFVSVSQPYSSPLHK